MIKVLGIGSPFGDDQVGWKVVALLKKVTHLKKFIPDYLQIDHYDRPGIRLLELMKNSDIVYLIDAVKSGNPIGTCHRFKNEEIEEAKCLISTHDIGIAQVLQLGKVLNSLPNTIILYGIEIDSRSDLLLIESAVHQTVKFIELDLMEVLIRN